MKNKESVKIYIFVAIMVIVLLALGAFFSYAYFANEANITNTLPLNVTFEDGVTANLVFTGEDDMTLTVLGEKMLYDSYGSVAGSTTTGIDVSLESPLSIECSYDLVWKWSEDTPNQYFKTADVDKEYTISGSNGSKSIAEKQLNNEGYTTTLGTFYIRAANSSTSQSWNFNANFYNANAVQDAHAGATYKGKITAQNAVCYQYVPTLSETILALADGEDRISATNGSTYRVIDQNGVRYEGANPDNYVNYNNEEWRIIGVFEGSEIGLNSGEYYTKIVKLSALNSNMQFDDDAQGWVDSTLNAYLNNEYLESVLSDTAVEMIAKDNFGEYSLWSLRTMPSSTSWATATSDVWYNAEKNGVAGYKDGVKESALTETRSAVALIYLSDFGYALYDNTSGTTCINTSVAFSAYANCKTYNWLGQIGQYIWTMSPHNSVTTMQYAIMMRIYGQSVTSKNVVMPTLYLDSSVKFVGGTGQKGENAYQISL